MYHGAIYTPHNCPYAAIQKIEIQPRHAGNPGTRQKFKYKDTLCAFDIETSGVPEIEQSFMYIWQFAIEGVGVVIGRTWNEFLYFLGRLRTCCGAGERYLIYVHNLSYEFQFLRGIYDFQPRDVFALRSRKVLKAVMYDTFEFRCSYIQSNMSLDNFCRSMNVEHEKLRGFDYDKIRYYDTPLSDFEISYCIHDVVGLIEAMRARLSYDNDNFYTIPLTATGYARRDAKNAYKTVPRSVIKEQLPPWRVFQYLRRAFRGGNVHANRHYAGVILKDVGSSDRASSYPDVLLNRRMPVSAFYEIPHPTAKDLYNQMEVRERAVLVELEFYNIRLKDPRKCGCPYLAIAKCDVSSDRVNDNGRILSASYVKTVLTDIDYKIVRSMYEWDEMNVLTLFHARYGFLPSAFRDLVREYFRRKTEWKNVPGREADYRAAKERINSLYGMTAYNACKPEIIFKDNDFVEDETKDGPDLLDAYYKRAFQSYAVGVWVTAWARWELQQMIDLCENTPGAAFVYTDTDSVKYLGEVDFSEYNKRCQDTSAQHGGMATDPAGHVHYLGVAEFEGRYAEFCTLGAKKYVYTEPHPVPEIGPPAPRNRCYITIAGVSKEIGGIELDAAGGIEAFKDGFTFYDAGGLEAVYNDDPEEKYYFRPEDGEPIPITSNVYLRPSTYTIGLTAEYIHLLEVCYIL